MPVGNGQGEEHESKRVEYHRKYVNVDYYFSVQIPQGLVGLGAIDNAPNHGFILEFPGNVDFSDCISVFAEYDVMEFEKQDAETTEKYEPEGFHVLEKTTSPIRLGGFKAEKRWQRLQRKSDGAQWIWIDVWLKRGVKGDGIIYSLLLRTPESSFKERKKIFDSLMASFHLLP
jgi:hypothetical protein